MHRAMLTALLLHKHPWGNGMWLAQDLDLNKLTYISGSLLRDFFIEQLILIKPPA
jgi:hypothetical protein